MGIGINTKEKAHRVIRYAFECLTEVYLARVIEPEESWRRRRDLDQAKESLEAQVDRQTETARLCLNIDEFCRRVQAGLE